MATTTPNYGWSVPTSTDYVAQGAVAIETLGDSVDSTLFTALGGAYPGMRLVKKQTIGNAVSSVNVTGAFSSTYENYKVIVSGGVSSIAGSGTLLMRMGATTSGYRVAQQYALYGAASVLFYSTTSASTWFVGGISPDNLNADITLMGPQLAKNTTCFANYSEPTVYLSQTGTLANTTQYTDFTFIPSSGTLTGGTIYVYGYGVS